MASPHCKVKNGKRGNGASHAQYVAGVGRYNDREDVLYVEDGNLPKWAANADEFFAAADTHERANGRVYKEVEAAIPREAKDPVQWAKDYARELLGDKHAYRLGVHDKEANDGGRNAHIHLMFSARTMDGHDRSMEKFFSRAVSKKGPADPSKGGARKSEYWDSREAVTGTRKLFESHIQRVAPDFKLTRSDAPEPKIGPDLKRGGKNYAKSREARAEKVNELRALKKERGELDKEIAKEQARAPEVEKADWSRFKGVAGSQGNALNRSDGEKEQAREREAEKPKSRTDDLWAQLNGKRPADQPTWREFVSQKKAEQRQQDKAAQQPQKEETKPADWSRFKGVAGSQGNEQPAQRKDDKMNPMNTLPSGPGYFPESKAERAQNAAEAPALQRLDREKNERSEAQEQGSEKGREKSVSDDLWERMNQERAEKEQRDRDRDDSMDMDR